MSGTQQTEALRIAEILERSPIMTTDKPEVLAWRWRKPIVNGQGETVGASAWEYAATPGFLPWWANDPLIRLSDYEALQAECEELKAQLSATQPAAQGMDAEDTQTIDTAKSLQRVKNYLERVEQAKGYSKECIHAFFDKGGDEIPLLVADLKVLLQQVTTTSTNTDWDEKIDAAMAAQARNKKGIEK